MTIGKTPAGDERSAVDLSDAFSSAIDQPNACFVDAQGGDIRGIERDMPLQDQAARLVHGNAVVAQNPQLAVLGVQLQIANAGALRIMRLGERNRCAIAQEEGLHFSLPRIRHEKKMLLGPFEHRLMRCHVVTRFASDHKIREKGKEQVLANTMSGHDGLQRNI